MLDLTCLSLAGVCFGAAKRWPFDDFMENWQENVPDTMQVDLSFLDGVALIAETGVAADEREISYFPAAALPIPLRKRMATLFAKQSVWSLAGITPYLV